MVKGALKAAARGVARVAAAPFITSFWLRAAWTGRDRSLESSTQLISLVPGITGQYLRRAFLQSVVASCDAAACIEFGTLFSRINVRIGRSAYIGPRCHIGWAEIGDDALIAAGVHITSGARIHGFSDPDVPIREQRGELSMVRIGNGAWVGSNAVVLADVGEGAIVAAGAVVTKPVPPFAVVAGVPARVMRDRIADRARGGERGYAAGELG
jgi:acetyltransferase-like isoleucine patch superfamily enzyme